MIAAPRMMQSCSRSPASGRVASRQQRRPRARQSFPTFPLTYLAWTMFALGFPNQGHALTAEAIAVSRGGSEFYYAMALSNGCYHMCGDCAAVEVNVAMLLDPAAKKGIVVFHAVARLFEGWTRAGRGAPEGRASLQEIDSG